MVDSHAFLSPIVFQDKRDNIAAYHYFFSLCSIFIYPIVHFLYSLYPLIMAVYLIMGNVVVVRLLRSVCVNRGLTRAVLVCSFPASDGCVSVTMKKHTLGWDGRSEYLAAL